MRVSVFGYRVKCQVYMENVHRKEQAQSQQLVKLPGPPRK